MRDQHAQKLDLPEPDPLEEELVAYLDDELDPTAMRVVEARLAADPAVRAKAEALRKSYELLDYLPQPEPSGTFASRTVEKLPNPPAASAPANLIATQFEPLPGAASSPSQSRQTSLPAATSPRSQRWRWPVGLALAACLALVGGYLGSAAVNRPKTPDSTPDDRVLELLPLYAVADSVEFVSQLAAPDLFGDGHEFSAAAAGPGDLPPRTRDELEQEYRSMSPAKQERVRWLDAQLHGADGKPLPLMATLRAYRAWLDRLPDPDRVRIFAAAPHHRIDVVRTVYLANWVQMLPLAYRKKYDESTPEVRAELTTLWRREETQRRDAVTRRLEKPHRMELPWPFEDETMRTRVRTFVQHAYHPETKTDGLRCRLAKEERTALEQAQADADHFGNWAAWFEYGRVVFELSKQHEMFPDSPTAKLIVKPTDLWEAGKIHFNRVMPYKVIEPTIGKWPDFPLAVWREHIAKKTPAKDSFPIPPDFHLGPARPIEFRTGAQSSIDNLYKKLAPAETSELKQLEGKWPEYPRKLIQLANRHDVSIYGAMLPGSPYKWEQTYGTHTGTKPAGPVRHFFSCL